VIQSWEKPSRTRGLFFSYLIKPIASWSLSKCLGYRSRMRSAYLWTAGFSGEAGMETHAAWSEVSGESRRAVGKASRRNETVFMSGGGTDGVVD
jgi:hypothetical protein